MININEINSIITCLIKWGEKMVKLRIVDIDNYKYYLEDEYKNNYTINLDFFDLKEKLKIGNYIYI